MKIAQCLINKPNAKKRLFFFHHAGGDMSYYFEWFKLFSQDVELVVLELPGRRSSFEANRITDFSEAIELLSSEILELNIKPFSFFGHSMGAMLAYGVTLKFQSQNITPEYLFVSGCNGPVYIAKNLIEMRSNLGEDLLIEKLKQMGGVPQEIFEDTGLIDLFLPIIRADFKICESFNDFKKDKVNVPIVSFWGYKDLEKDSTLFWRDSTNDSFQEFCFTGNHFFLTDHKEEIIRIIESKILI
jgi:medium-chain acyl-[acyl-carrier-protein] hydrolase